MNTTIQTIINAVVDSKSVEEVLTITGLTKPQLFGHMASMKKHGLVSYEDGNLVLTEEGKKLVEAQPVTAQQAVDQTDAVQVDAATVAVVPKTGQKREERTDTKKHKVEALLRDNSNLTRKLKIALLMEHAAMTYNGANTYIYNYDKKQKAIRSANAATPTNTPVPSATA